MFSAANKLEYMPFESTIKSFDQEILFSKYTGLYPEIGKQYYSIFRKDRTPDCRFKWFNGILYYLDNATHNGHLYYNIQQTVAELYNISQLEAINKIVRENKQEVGLSVFNKTDTFNLKPLIKFEYGSWENNNYFMIQPDQLYFENVFRVTRYWINKQDGQGWKMNNIYNPKEKLTIAYYFPHSDTVKLYFPNQEFKFYTNSTDIFGEEHLDLNLEVNHNVCIITKSQKDRLLLQYLYGIPSIAPQSENQPIPNHIISKLFNYNKQFILYDYDATGIQFACSLSAKTGIPFIVMDIAKDVYDATILYGQHNVDKYIHSLIEI